MRKGWLKHADHVPHPTNDLKKKTGCEKGCLKRNRGISMRKGWLKHEAIFSMRKGLLEHVIFSMRKGWPKHADHVPHPTND